MRHDIYYEGVAGKVNLSHLPFIYQESDLFDYEHDYDIQKRADHKSSYLNYVGFSGSEKTLVLGIKDSQDYRNIMGNLENIFEQDIINETWGKIYVNGSYVECQVMGNKKEYWNLFKRINRATLTILIRSSLWITEETFAFSIHSEEANKRGWSYPSSYPSSYNKNRKTLNLFNSANKPTLARITIYGEISKPIVSIGGTPYKVDIDLLEGERLIIDPMSKTLEKITTSGEIVNAFNNRDKINSVFTKVLPGENTISLNGNFSVEVTLLHERMEPKWK